ncbi:MAG: hypothetical protein HY831_04315 [Candidatus Aenigmarchaeota archaeon]|nr:hypothetical protein [Candidatus Aenigmarchaeota archaeon]
MAEEKVYNISLREAFKKDRIARANYAVTIVEDYLKTHTKKDDIKMGRHLNSLIWSRGPKKPPRAVRVKAVIDKDTVKVEILGKEYEDFIAQKVKKKEKFLEQLKARMGAKAEQKAEEAKMAEEGKTADEVKEELAKEEDKVTTDEVKKAVKKAAEKEVVRKEARSASDSSTKALKKANENKK